MKSSNVLLLPVAAALLAGCSTVNMARRAQETDSERTVTFAETGLDASAPIPMAALEGVALTNAPAVVQARQEAVSAQIALREVDASYVPRVDGTVGYTYASQNVDPHNTEWDGEGAFRGSLSLSMLVWDFGKTRASARQAAAALVAAEEGVRSAEVGARHGVRAACFGLGRALAMRDVADEKTAAYAEHLQQTRDRFEVGAVMSYDVTKAEVDFQNARLDQIAASNAVETARAALNLALGLAENPVYELGDCSFPDYGDADIDALMEVARTNAPALAAARAGADAAKAYVDYTIRNLYPTISLGLTFDASGDKSPLLWNYAAAGNVAQSLFSAGSKNRQIEEAVARMRIARSQAAEAEQQLYNQLLTALLNAGKARESLEVARLAEKSARENFDVVSSRYDVGDASALERTDAQVALSAAEAAVVSADYDYRDTQILVARLLGE